MRVSAFIVTGFKKFFPLLVPSGEKKNNTQQLGGTDLKSKCQIKHLIYNLIISKPATLFWKACD